MRQLALVMASIVMLCTACYSTYQISLDEMSKLQRGVFDPENLVSEDGQYLPPSDVASVGLKTKDGDELAVAAGDFTMSEGAVEILVPVKRTVAVEDLVPTADVRVYSPVKTVWAIVGGGVALTVLVTGVVLGTIVFAGRKSFN